jgi:hypothetical protein
VGILLENPKRLGGEPDVAGSQALLGKASFGFPCAMVPPKLGLWNQIHRGKEVPALFLISVGRNERRPSGSCKVRGSERLRGREVPEVGRAA